jgi:hypothetical protein
MVACMGAGSPRLGGSFRNTMTFDISEAFGWGLLTRLEG